jgi:hypothetical protein
VEDALKAFEAYYYYLAIDDFEQAANIIINRETINANIPRLLVAHFIDWVFTTNVFVN